MLCERVCGFEQPPVAPAGFPRYYGARQRDVAQVMKSRSGGVFAALASRVIAAGGAVYGAALADDFSVRHRRVTDLAGLDALRGSKYVQSDLAGVFRAVKADLLGGLPVLFSGTPCQTATLLRYVPPRLRGALQVVDVVCHGVPGPRHWAEFLKDAVRRRGRRLAGVIFRDKERTDWRRHREMLRFEGDGEPRDVKYRFYTDLLFRPSCSSCPFTTTDRPSDLTLADFWGYERTGTHLNDDHRGLSLIMVNTPKGAEMFEAVKPALEWFETTRECAMQPSLEAPVPRHPRADAFARAAARHGFRYAMWRYGDTGPVHRLRKIIDAIKRRL